MKVPKGWRIQSVGDLCDFESGHGFGPRDWASSGMPIIRIQNLNGSRTFNYFQGEPLSEWVVEPGELLFAWAGVKGVSFGPCVWRGPRGLLNQHIFRIRPKPNVQPDYLHELLVAVTARIESNAHGFKKNLVHVRRADITGQKWPVPPLGEQRRIAEILGAWDEAIEKVQALVQAKHKLKRALMHQLLTPTRRFPQFNGQWRKCKLRDQFERVQRQVGAEEVQALSITATVGFVDQAGKFSRVIAGAQLEKYTLLERGEFAYNKGNSNAYPQGCIYRLDEFDRGAVPHVYFSFRPANDQAHSDFYKFYFEGGGLNHQLSRVINAGVRNDGLLNLNAEDFFGVSIPVPPPDEQAHIAGVLATLTKQIAALQKQANALTTQKRGLMQKLLTGQVRVKGGANE